MTQELKESNLSPMMQQWKTLKEQAKEALLLFRLGDFYEAFFEDAKILSETVDVILTQRQSIPMSGIPHHQLENYLEKLIEKQFIVAIAEQLENADASKGLVKREITEIISPATYLSGKRQQPNYYFACIYSSNDLYGLSFLELSTGEFFTVELTSWDSAVDELVKMRPVEILIPQKFLQKNEKSINNLKSFFSFRLTKPHESRFEISFVKESLKEQFGSKVFIEFETSKQTCSMIASGALIKYLKTDLCRSLAHINFIKVKNHSHYLKIDHSTIHHLDILNIHKERPSLQKTLDHTLTPMGARTLHFFLTHPLLDVKEIKNRQNNVLKLTKDSLYKKVREFLYSIKDLQRLTKRIDLNIIQPKELISFKTSLFSILSLYSFLKSQSFDSYFPKLDSIESIKDLVLELESALEESAPQKIGQGRIFKSSYCKELDDLYAFKANSESFLENYQNNLREELGIKTLKANYNRAFGYFIEVSRGQAHLMPTSFERLQTLVNAERFVTKELKEYEHKILNCEAQIVNTEEREFQLLKDRLKNHSQTLEILAKEVGFLDVFCSFAKISEENGYICPIVDDSSSLLIEEGKHPVLSFVHGKENFISNTTDFSNDVRMILITGPNMAGKSTYIRQTALLALMAQIGCFVPAKKMHIGFFDQIFSRIGASDDLSRGMSTFMVEMSETANILHKATTRSLIILDEIGRGTSTYDGIAIASAVAEYLVRSNHLSPKTLFATHYFELTKLQENFSQIRNYHVAILEKGEEIIFLRKILPGVLNKSFGIHVAKLAGIPSAVIQRAKTLLKELQSDDSKYPKNTTDQYSLFDISNFSIEEESIKKIENLELENLTPKEALNFLYSLKEELENR